MTATKMGVLIGAVLALSWVILGFWACVLVALGMAVGAVVGRVIDGRLNLATVADAFRGKRSSS